MRKRDCKFFLCGAVSIPLLVISLLSIVFSAFLVNSQLNPNQRFTFIPRAATIDECNRNYDICLIANPLNDQKCQTEKTSCLNSASIISENGSCSYVSGGKTTSGKCYDISKYEPKPGVTNIGVPNAQDSCASGLKCYEEPTFSNRWRLKSSPVNQPPPPPSGGDSSGGTTGGTAGTTGTFTLTVKKAIAVDPTTTGRGINQLSIAVNPGTDDCYTTEPASCAANTYSSGVTVSLTAGAKPGYKFKNWTTSPTSTGDNCGGKSTITCSLTMNVNKTITANFEQDHPAQTQLTSTGSAALCKFYRNDTGEYKDGNCYNDALYTCTAGVPNSSNSYPKCASPERCFEKDTFTQRCKLKTTTPIAEGGDCSFSHPVPQGTTTTITGKCRDINKYTCSEEIVNNVDNCATGLKCYKEPDFTNKCPLKTTPGGGTDGGTGGGGGGLPLPGGGGTVPTNTPTPTPTLTPTTGSGSGSVDMAIKLKLRYQGIVPDVDVKASSMKVKVKLAGGPLTGPTEFQETDFAILGDKTLEGTVNFKVPAAGGYRILIKGLKHLQRKVCDPSPTEAIPATYSCGDGAITLVAGSNSFDFTSIVLVGGDLPLSGGQSGIVDSEDLAFIHQNLGSKDAGVLAVGDLNLDGIVDSQDFSLVIAGLSVKSDEQ